MKITKDQISILLLGLFHLVGLVGLSYEPTRKLFQLLTPFNLLLTLALIIWVKRKFSRGFTISFIFIVLFGYLIELAGVTTGLIFGSYTYGDSLGMKLLSVPVIIGINWYILSIAARGTMMLVTKNKWVQAFAAAILMVILDLLIEPVASSLDFWSWQHDIIPIQNYMMWFVTSLILQYFLTVWRAKIHRKLAFGLLIIQFLFFGILNMVL